MSKEDSFINDGVKTVKYNVSRKIPIIPVYDAMQDKRLKGFFESTNVKGVIAITIHGDVSLLLQILFCKEVMPMTWS